MHLTNVDLPAPFSPRSAWKLPGAMRIDTSSSAVKAPKRMVICSVSTSKARSGRGAGQAHASPAIRVALSETAPKTPPCILTILIAAW